MKQLLRSLFLSAALLVCSGAGTLFAQPQTQTVQDQKETTVYGTRTGKRYHREGCQSLSKSKIPMTIKEAKAKGLTPCHICKPPE